MKHALGISLALMLLATAARGETLTLPADFGGSVRGHHMKFYELRQKYDQLRVVTTCQSACAMIFANWSKDQICFGAGARVGFHTGTNGTATNMMMTATPADIRQAIDRRGGWTRTLMWFSGPQLWALGYRKC
jgi:hypothetical protein